MSIDSKIALAMSAYGASFEEVHDNLVQIADEFAIGFAEWVDDKGLEVVLNQKPKNTKELLEIYKKTL